MLGSVSPVMFAGVTVDRAGVSREMVVEGCCDGCCDVTLGRFSPTRPGNQSG